MITNWDDISTEKGLAETFMIEHQNQLNWDIVLVHQILREEFIEEMEHVIFWERLAYYQQLSEAFILRHKNKLDWGSIKTAIMKVCKSVYKWMIQMSKIMLKWKV